MLSEQRWVIYDDEICDCLLFRKVILYSREENKCMSSVIIIIITYQQAYLHIAHGFVTWGIVHLRFFCCCSEEKRTVLPLQLKH